MRNVAKIVRFVVFGGMVGLLMSSCFPGMWDKHETWTLVVGPDDKCPSKEQYEKDWKGKPEKDYFHCLLVSVDDGPREVRYGNEKECKYEVTCEMEDGYGMG